MIKTKFGNARIHHKGHYIITSGKEGNHGKFLHRLIFEDYYKCTILPFVDCHHINGNKLDNRIENLELMYHGEHSRHHNTGDSNPRGMKGKKLSKEARQKLSKAKKGKRRKPEPHILAAGFTSAGNRQYRLIVDSKPVAFSVNKHKLEQMIKDGSYKTYEKKKKHEIDMDLLQTEFESGKTMEELGKQFGCSRRTISRRLSKIYSKEELMQHRGAAITASLTGKYKVGLPSYKELLRLNKQYSYAEIARMYNCSSDTVIRRIQKGGNI
jgi:DNA-binding CsgD family transcriptional regulator